MIRSFITLNFEPLLTLYRAVSVSEVLNADGLLAYDKACAYYGEERVAIQKTDMIVEDVTVRDPVTRKQDALGRVVNCTFDERTPAVLRRTIKQIREELDIISGCVNSLFIHWPELRVTNENDNYIDLKNVFVRIPLGSKGMCFPEREPFTVFKATFTRKQWNKRYIHSHVRDYRGGFQHMCLGSGPIRNTIATLKSHPTDEVALDFFFWELDKVMHVESLKGVPYIRMSTVQENTTLTKVNHLDMVRYSPFFINRNKALAGNPIKPFLKSFISAVEIPLVYRNGHYTLGCSFLDFVIMLSNYMSKWDSFRNYGWTHGLKVPEPISNYLPKTTLCIKDGALYEVSESNSTNRAVPNNVCFNFNGVPYKLTVEDSEVPERDSNRCVIVPAVAAAILNFILTSINTATSIPYDEEEKTNTMHELSDTLLSGLSEKLSKEGGKTTGSFATTG